MHPEAQAMASQYGVPPAHDVSHAPHVSGLVRSVSQPSSWLALQSA